jgi:hypothetical protein
MLFTHKKLSLGQNEPIREEEEEKPIFRLSGNHYIAGEEKLILNDSLAAIMQSSPVVYVSRVCGI